MQQFQYATKSGTIKTFTAVDSTAALQAIKGFADAAPNTGVAIVQQPTQAPAPTSVTSPQGVQATALTPVSAPNLPTPTAPQVQQDYQAGIQGDVERAREDVDTARAKERDEAIQREKDLQERLEIIQSESDPRERATFAQEERIIQGQLNAAESASRTLKEDFESRRRTVGELESLLTQGNKMIENALKRPVALSVLHKSASRTIQDIQARAGILQAVLSGLDGNINLAHSIINNASNAVRASWQDIVNYNDALIKLIEEGALRIDKIHADFAKDEKKEAEGKLKTAEATAEYIKKLMIDPKTAQFIADAGITLIDSIEEINVKMANQTQVMDMRDFTNSMASKGYTQVPTQVAGAVSFDVGGQTVWFKPPASNKTGGGTSVADSTIDAWAQRILDGTDKISSVPLDIRNQVITRVVKLSESSEIETSVISKKEAEQFLRDNLTTAELKKLSDWAGTSKWWRFKSSDINDFFAKADQDQLSRIVEAINEGYNINEIINFLG